jgi:hypothetical protein
MTKAKVQLLKSVALISGSLLFCPTVLASIVYDNTTTSLNNRAVYSVVSSSAGAPFGNSEFGDQVFLTGSDRRVSDFQFDYFVSANASGNETGELRFYQNNGGTSGTTPGTLIYTSGEFSLDKGFQTVVAQALSVTVPNTFTWTVVFRGVESTENVGLRLFNPPTTGASLDDYWFKNADSTWSTLLIDGGVTPANFAARITAVPEPSTIALALLGAIGLLGFKRSRNRSV